VNNGSKSSTAPPGTGPGCFEPTRTTGKLASFATARSNVYLTLDFWTSRESYAWFMAAHAAEYKTIDSAGENLTVNERRVGAYEMVNP
jgi:hypothetical protein